jgi:hypothetical protein
MMDYSPSDAELIRASLDQRCRPQLQLLGGLCQARRGRAILGCRSASCPIRQLTFHGFLHGCRRVIPVEELSHGGLTNASVHLSRADAEQRTGCSSASRQVQSPRLGSRTCLAAPSFGNWSVSVTLLSALGLAQCARCGGLLGLGRLLARENLPGVACSLLAGGLLVGHRCLPF